MKEDTEKVVGIITRAIVGGTMPPEAVGKTEIGSVHIGTEAKKENAVIGVTEGIETGIEETDEIETTGITTGKEMVGEAAVTGIGNPESTVDDILAPEPGLEAEEIPVEKRAPRV